MKALVIGGNRFFGKRLVKLLLERNVEVSVLNRGQLDDEFGGTISRIKLDRRELRKDHPALGGGRWDIIYDQICYDATEAGGACSTFRGRADKYIFTSTKSVYPEAASIKEEMFDPKTYFFEQRIESVRDYGEAKRQAEATFFQNGDFQVAAVRFPVVMGLDDYTKRLRFHVEHIQQRKPIYFPNIDARMCFVQAADAAEFLSRFVQQSWIGPINCCSREPIALREMMELIEKSTGRKGIYAKDSSSGEHSPYGIRKDSRMATDINCLNSGLKSCFTIRNMNQSTRNSGKAVSK